jgi:hypothetical protein
VTVVVPTLNEAENLPLVLPRIDPAREVLVVDGNSSDGSCEIALRLHPRVVGVASFERRRLHGKAKLRTIPDGWGVLKTILCERLRPTGLRWAPCPPTSNRWPPSPAI